MKANTKPDFTISLTVDKTPREAFKAILNVSGWWSAEIEGESQSLNDVFFYHYKDIHLCKMKLIELVPGERAVWQVLDNYFKFTKDKSEWIGTKIVFDIAKKGKQTVITFTHQGLVPQYECYEICREAWTTYITESLRDLVTTGKGRPNKKETKGFNAQLVEKWNLDHDANNGFSTTIVVDPTPKQVFNAINNVTGWWTENLQGKTKKLNDEFTVTFGKTYVSIKITELLPDTKIVWLVTDCYKDWVKGNKKEWNGTKIIFDIFKKGKKTQLRFTHQGLVPQFECYSGCANAWTEYVEGSLQDWINTKGAKSIPKLR